jgi:hypothetical protein
MGGDTSRKAFELKDFKIEGRYEADLQPRAPSTEISGLHPGGATPRSLDWSPFPSSPLSNVAGDTTASFCQYSCPVPVSYPFNYPKQAIH